MRNPIAPHCFATASICFACASRASSLVAVDFDDDAGPDGRVDIHLAVARHGLEADPVHDLGGRRHDARLQHRVDRRTAVLEGPEHDLQRAAFLGHGNEFEEHPGDDAEGPFGAREQALQVVAGDVFYGLAAGLQDRAVRQHDLETHDVIGRHAVLDGPHAAGVLRHVAADGRELPARRVGRIEEPPGGAVVVEIDRAHPGLGCHHHVSLVQFDDPRHAVEGERDAALQGHAAAGAAARRAARRDGDRMFIRDGHYLRHLLGGQRPDDEIGLVCRQQGHEG